MSRCAHGTSPVKRLRNSAATIEPRLAGLDRVDDVGVAALDRLRRSRRAAAAARRARRRAAPASVDGRAPRRRRCRTARRGCRRSAVTIAPVSVAKSTIRSAPSSTACARQSASTSRPSASVLMISIVVPVLARTMSPGLSACPHGMFSVAPIDRDARAPAAPAGRSRRVASSTAAPPDMSNFISLIFVAGLERDAAGVERHGLADERRARARRRPPARSGA